MSFFLSALGLAGGLASSLGRTFGAIYSQKQANKANKEINEENLDFQKEQFQYQKYLNNNQFQIQAADAQKAGINPLAMNPGSLSSGHYSNASNPMESVYNGSSGLSDILLKYADISNQNSMNEKTNETNKQITAANNQNQKDIAILKILSDEKIASDLNQHQKDMLIAQLSSNEKIASGNLTETTRHNKAIELVQDRLATAQEVLNNSTASHYKKMDYINEVNSSIDNMIKESNNERLNEQLKVLQGELKVAQKNANTSRIATILGNINDLIRSAVLAINPLSGVFPTHTTNKIGF